MKAMMQGTGTTLVPSGLAMEEANLITLRHVKSCWYCSRPLFDRRSFCSTECREALYEDNELARERRQILGCQC